jgi:hypothetical protein
MQKYQGNSTNAPRETFINDQRHMLAYINPFEEDLLRNYGGTGKRALVAFLHFRLRLLKGPWIETTTLTKPLEHRIQIANDLQLRTLPLRNGEIGLPLPLKQSGTTV